MTTITEDSLAFDFPAKWDATKYDEWTFYIKHFQNVCGAAKGVDILAIDTKRVLWLIEVKDYRVVPRQKSIELADEIAIKVRDTLAGVATAQVRANVEDERGLAGRAMACSDLKIVLHIEQPPKTSRLHPIEDLSKLLQKLKQLLRAIDYHPRVTNLADGNRFGWDVREV